MYGQLITDMRRHVRSLKIDATLFFIVSVFTAILGCLDFADDHVFLGCVACTLCVVNIVCLLSITDQIDRSENDISAIVSLLGQMHVKQCKRTRLGPETFEGELSEGSHYPEQRVGGHLKCPED